MRKSDSVAQLLSLAVGLFVMFILVSMVVSSLNTQHPELDNLENLNPSIVYEIIGPYEYTQQGVTKQIMLLRGKNSIIQKSLGEIPPTIMASSEYVLLTEDGLVLPLSPASIDYSLD